MSEVLLKLKRHAFASTTDNDCNDVNRSYEACHNEWRPKKVSKQGIVSKLGVAKLGYPTVFYDMGGFGSFSR